MFLGQKVDQFILRLIGILILIHHDVAELVLIKSQHIGMFPEQPNREHDDVIKIHRHVFAQALLVQLINLSNLSLAEIGVIQFKVACFINQGILGRGDR
ncbi:hypothetical protein DSECCO2_251480 [anaerobic digester metagenome]